MCDALETRPPERARLRIILKRLESFLADRNQCRRRIVRHAFANARVNSPIARVDDRAAVARARRRIDRIERREPQNVLGVDRVWIAQPMFDLGHRSAVSAARRPAGIGAGVHGLDTRRTYRACAPSSKYRSPRSSVCSMRFRPRPRRGAAGNAMQPSANRRSWRRASEPLRERRAACAKSCAERPMRRSGRSRPSSRRIGRLSQGSLARLRRPSAFDQAAQHDAIDLSEGALRADRRCARAPPAHRPPHHVVCGAWNNSG